MNEAVCSGVDDGIPYSYDPFTMLHLTPPTLSPRLLSPTPPPLPPVYPSSNHPVPPLPCGLKSRALNALSALEIQNAELRAVQEVINQNSDLRTENGSGTLSQRLAIFGEAVTRRCTPNGSKRFPALPQKELYELKTIVFNCLPKFHERPDEFCGTKNILWQ